MSGRHARRLPRVTGVIGLALALLAGGRLLTMPEPAPDPGGTGAGTATELSVRDRWPDARVVENPGRLADGRSYTPWFHLDAQTSVGTALTADGNGMRLVVRGADNAARELMRLPADDNPQFNGFTAAGDDLLWMVSAGESGARSTLYRANWRTGTGATALTADTGDVIFFNTQHDLVVADGRVHWAVARADEQVTEVRSVPLSGGKVDSRRVDGAYALSTWPWLTSAGTTQSGPVELRNLATGARVAVPGSTNELVTCSPTWCRVMVLGATGNPARIDMIRPDGGNRQRVAGGGITSAVPDVALVDRFEVLAHTNASAAATTLKLILYDLTASRSVVLATGVATVQARGPVVWWSTGDDQAIRWYSLDLRTLA